MTPTTTAITQPSGRPACTQPLPVRPLARPRHPPRAPNTPTRSQSLRQQTSDTPTATSLRKLGPDPDPFPNRPRRRCLPGEDAASRLRTNAQARSNCAIKIGIETEFYLKALDPKQNEADLHDFMKILAENHDKKVPTRYPRMRQSIRPYEYCGPYTEWCLVLDETLGPHCLPWGIELVSPVFLGFPGSTWRKGVEETWRYLKKNYNVLGSDTCATHIHIGLESGFDLVHLKRIAQAVIHFETAFEALVPSCRRNNPYVKSNWLDAPGLAQKNKSRPESIAAIGATSNPEQLLALLHPVARLHVHKIRFFSWNFFSWYSKGSIEFRKPPASVTSVEALSWAELAMSFVQASIGCESSKTLQDIPPSAGGLLWFLEKFGTEQGVNEPARLQRLWRGTHPELFIEPKPQPQDNTDLKPEQVFELYDSLTIMATADKARVMALMRNARGRYWQQ